MRKIYISCIFLTLLSLSACDILKRGTGYLNSTSTNPLEAPPDLVTPQWEDSLEIPKTANDRISALETQSPALGAAVLPEFLDVRVRREGPTSWLEVDTDPVTLWPLMRKFWQEQEYVIGKDEPTLGYIETEWRQHTDRSVDPERKLESYDITARSFVRALSANLMQ